MVGVRNAAKNRMVAVNERGLRIGESHPRAVLSDHEVDLMWELREEVGHDGRPRYSYAQLAAMFEVHKGTVAKIISGQRRQQYAVAFKRVRT